MHHEKHLLGSLILLFACGKGSPEDAGRLLADKKCACLAVEWVYDQGLAEAMVDAVKRDPTLDRSSAEALQADYHEKNGKVNLKQRLACKKEYDELESRIEIDFPKDEDRATIKNLRISLTKECRKQHNEELRGAEKWFNLIDERKDNGSLSDQGEPTLTGSEMTPIIEILDASISATDTLMKHDAEGATNIRTKAILLKARLSRKNHVSSQEKKDTELVRSMTRTLIMRVDSLISSRM